jgi:uncharacterized damage-inducible protein DinB
MERDTLLAVFDSRTEPLLTDLRAVSPEEFSSVPKGGTWSVAHVAEHLVKLERLTVMVLQGKTTDPERDPGKRLGLIEKSFRNRTRKYTAMGPIVPDDVPENPGTLVERLTVVRRQIREILANESLESLCTGFEHGIFGSLTRLEWGWFVAHHGERHRLQVEEISEALE